MHRLRELWCLPELRDLRDPLAAIAPGRGAADGLATSQASPGSEHLITWDSRAPLLLGASSADQVQGIGDRTLRGVALKIQARDKPDGATEISGAESPSLVVAELQNQNAPQIRDVRVRRAEIAHGASPMAIEFRLIDEESDPAEVSIQYAHNLSEDWTPCKEYRLPQSEGRYDLATAPTDGAGAGGIMHAILWDPTGESF